MTGLVDITQNGCKVPLGTPHPVQSQGGGAAHAKMKPGGFFGRFYPYLYHVPFYLLRGTKMAGKSAGVDFFQKVEQFCGPHSPVP